MFFFLKLWLTHIRSAQCPVSIGFLTKGFLTFSRGIKMEHWAKIGLSYLFCCTCISQSRSSQPEAFCKKGVLRNFAKFIGKHLCQSLFFNKVAGLRRTPVNFAKFLRIPFSTEHLWWLLLSILMIHLIVICFYFIDWSDTFNI